MAEDLELKAIRTIIELMKPLDENRSKPGLGIRLEATRHERAPVRGDDSLGGRAPASSVFAGGPVKDIRSLTAEKQPRSANEMVALIAYYLSELAPASESSPIVNVEMIRKYFKMAGFPMPRVPKAALTNAAAAGYLENVKLEPDQKKPTQRQKALHVFRKRKLSKEEMSAPELTINLVEELSATITRTAYTRGAKGAHTPSSAAEVRQLKMWIDAVLGELLEIHRPKPLQRRGATIVEITEIEIEPARPK